MQTSVFDLRAFNLPPFLFGAGTCALLAAVTLYSVAADQVLGGPGNRVAAGVIGGVLALLVVVALLLLPLLLRPRKLVIDHEGIRVEGGGRRRGFRVAWTELAGVGLIVDDRKRRRRARSYTLLKMPPSLTTVVVVLELVPKDADAQRRHPELHTAWLLGGKQAWRIPLTTGPGDPLDIGPVLRRGRPELWRGERSGSLFSRRQRSGDQGADVVS